MNKNFTTTKKPISVKKPSNLQELSELFKNKSGGPEAESTLSDSKFDKDFVSVWSCKSDIGKIIARCGSYIKSFDVTYDPSGEASGCHLLVDRKAFRGISYAFKRRG